MQVNPFVSSVIVSTQSKRTPQCPESIKKATGAVYALLENRTSIFICSGTFLGNGQVETSLHGIQKAFSFGTPYIRFGNSHSNIIKITRLSQNDDLAIISINNPPNILPAPNLVYPPQVRTPIMIVHYPNGIQKVNFGTYEPSRFQELTSFGNYSSGPGSCGGGVYFFDGNQWGRMGHHRYASTMHSLKAFGAYQEPPLILGGDAIANRTFDTQSIQQNRQGYFGPLRFEQPKFQFESYGPDIPEAAASAAYKGTPEIELTYQTIWKGTGVEYQPNKNDDSGMPIRGISVFLKYQVTPNSKKKLPGTNGIPNERNISALYVISPNPHELKSYRNKDSVTEFYGTFTTEIGSYVSAQGSLPPDQFKIKFGGIDFYIYKQSGTEIEDALSRGDWYGKRNP